MTTVASLIERFDALPKHELVQIAARLKATHHHVKENYGKAIKRVVISAAQSSTAVVVGAGFGLLELKAPRIPKTRLRWDSLLGLAGTLTAMSGLAGEATPIVQSMADSATGHGSGRMSEKFFENHGVRRTAA